MQVKSPNPRGSMPELARFIAALLGSSFVLLAIYILLAARPLGWEFSTYALLALGLGLDFLAGAIGGRWPVSTLLWLLA